MHGQYENRDWSGKRFSNEIENFITRNHRRSLYVAQFFLPTDWTKARVHSSWVEEVESTENYAKQNSKILYCENPQTVHIKAPKNRGMGARTLPSGKILGPSPYVAEFNHVGIVGGGRFIVTNDGHLLHDELWHDPDGQYGVKPHFAQRLWKRNIRVQFTKKNIDEIKSGILLCCEHDTNYFHWLIETLPRVLLSERADIPPSVPFLIPNGLHPNLLSALRILNRKKREIIPIHKGHFYRLAKLYYPSDLTRIFDRYQGKISLEDCVIPEMWTKAVAEILFRETCKSDRKKGRKRKLYLSRRGANYRNLINEDEIAEMLFDEGFEIVDLANASLAMQVKLLRSADTVVSPTGAACTNQIFCEPGTRFFIMSSNHPSTNLYIFSQLGTNTGLDLEFLLGQCAQLSHHGIAVHDDYYVDPALVRESVISGAGSDNLMSPSDRIYHSTQLIETVKRDNAELSSEPRSLST